jgi:peptidyl-prolyl cis-trans isomerase SurA
MIVALIARAQSSRIVADKIIVIVGDKPILYSDIENLSEEMRRMGQIVSDSMKCVFVENKIQSRVLEIEAEKNLIVVTDEDVEAEINKALNHYLKNPHYMIEKEMIEQMKEDAKPVIRERKLREGMLCKIVNDITVTPSEVKDFFDKMTKKSDTPNFRNDYVQIAELALMSKRLNAVNAWIENKAAGYSIVVANETRQKCGVLIKYNVFD